MTGARFAGKVAVVSGSSADPSIGRATALRLAAEGAAVVINGRSRPELDAAEKAFRDHGFDVAAVLGSASEDTTINDLVTTALDRFGRLDLLVCTLGGTSYNGPWDELSREVFLETVSRNTWPTFALIREAARRGFHDGGAVVTVSSGSPKKTTPAMLAYAAAKSSLNAMTRTLARDLGARRIRVNAVAPGLTRTRATASLWAQDPDVAGHSVLPRATEADDIAGAATFLLSADAAAITGVVLDVDGGDHLLGGGWSPFAPR
ncbi:MAG: SDR family oxidoreductase [Acidimicrobiaceae bacterium]|nr:SDR family oxidoreductase [Acidimicrobiaceae bacterium]